MNRPAKDTLKLLPEKFYFAPIGGSEQFGVNCNLYIHDDAWLMVDLGMGFADHRLPGIDLILPDLDYVIENREKLCGLVVTHAHEDHIGAVAYLWPRLRCPIYCTPFTAEVLREKFAENKECKEAVIHVIKGGDKTDIGPFSIDFVHMAHSIPETVSMFIKTERIKAFHSADWNFDPKPVIGKPTDMKALEAIAREGVDVYIGDSTNSLYPGRAGSESDVESGLQDVIEECSGKVVVTLFASNVGRVQSICRAAKANGRNVAVLGRSLHRMIGAARTLGYLKDIPDFVPEEDMELIPDDKLVVIATGSQGESRAAMARISRGEWPGLKLGEGDTAIFSSREIPGNEKDIEQIKNNLAASKVKIIDPSDTEHKIHVSGHPYRDEVYEMLTTLKPKSVIPIHGEFIQLSGQAEVARGCGISNIIIPHNGDVFCIEEDGIDIAGYMPCGLLAVEPKRIVKVDHQGIRERRKLQFNGAIHATVVLDSRGEIIADPLVTTLGLVDEDNEDDLKFEDDVIEEIYAVHEDLTREELQNDDQAQEQFRIGVRRFANYVFGFKPVTNIHLVRV